MHKKSVKDQPKARILARELASELKHVIGGDGVMTTGGPGDWDITNVSVDQDNQG
jgi:hypothetical protein